MVAKLKREGFVAVVLTNDYGQGYTTWMLDCQRERAMFDPVVVRSVLNMEDGLGTEGLEDYLWEVYRWDGRIENLSVAWLREGSVFVIQEYDGKESLRIRSEVTWMTA